MADTSDMSGSFACLNADHYPDAAHQATVAISTTSGNITPRPLHHGSSIGRAASGQLATSAVIAGELIAAPALDLIACTAPTKTRGSHALRSSVCWVPLLYIRDLLVAVPQCTNESFSGLFRNWRMTCWLAYPRK